MMNAMMREDKFEVRKYQALDAVIREVIKSQDESRQRAFFRAIAEANCFKVNEYEFSLAELLIVLSVGAVQETNNAIVNFAVNVLKEDAV